MTYRPLPRDAQRLTVYFGESDRWQGKPLYLALLETLKAHGLAGATVTRGVAGFGAHSRIHTAAILRLSEDLPLRLEVVDAPERIAQAIDLLRPMLREGLMIVEEVRVLAYTHRNLHPLPADLPVPQAMTPDPVSVPASAPLAQAWQTMHRQALKAVPVVDEGGRAVGMLTATDILAPLSVAQNLPAEELSQRLKTLTAGLQVADRMSAPPVVAQADEPLGHAVRRMVDQGLKRLPVVDQGGRLVGVLSRVDVLRTVAPLPPERPPAPAAPDESPPPGGQRLRDLLTPEFPQVPPHAPLSEVVAALLEHAARRVVVVDAQGRPLGLITDADLVARVAPEARAGLLDALLRRRATPPQHLTARDLMSPGVLTAPASAPLIQALAQMLAANRKWLVVVDAQGRALGLVDRQRALNALLPPLQE